MTPEPITAVRVHAPGGPQMLRLETLNLDPPGVGEVRIRHHAIGLNYIDTYHRSGLYPAPLPAVIGQEAAGEVEALGPGVAGVNVGDRVAYGPGPMGAYASARNIPADQLIPLPPAIHARHAAAVLLKGMTAHMLLTRVIHVEPGWPILVHAAAGGVGLILVAWAKALGARVIGTVGVPEKAALARAAGCDDVIIYRQEDVAERVRALTGGEGARVVYDGVGAATFAASLDCLARRAMLVSYGNASGPPPAVAPLELAKRGSAYLTRPTLFDYVATPAERRASAKAVFDKLEEGVIAAHVGQEFALADVAAAHRALEARATTGSTLLIP